MSYAEISRRVHLSTPAVIERIEKMEEAGIITGYRASINPAALGYTISAQVTLTTDPVHYPTVRRIVSDSVEIESCDHVTGSAAFVMRVSAGSVEQLERVIGQFAAIGSTQTAIIMSSLDTSGTTLTRINAMNDTPD
jgi:Lrp/AsnC family leucine-responsive transcriptional regulator